MIHEYLFIIPTPFILKQETSYYSWTLFLLGFNDQCGDRRYYVSCDHFETWEFAKSFS